LALLTLDVNTRMTLTQGFWPQNRLIDVECDAMFFSNEDIHEEFAMDKHYVGFVRNRLVSSFCVVVDFHEGYMVLICVGNKEHCKPIWLVKVLLSPNFVRTSLNFHQIEMEYYRPSTKDQNMLRTYSGWNAKKCFRWTMDSVYGPVWINTDIILCAWKPRKGSKLKTMTIPKKLIDFAKDNLTCITTAKNDIKNGYEVEDEDGKT
jgi:hypothetical protein